MSQLENDEKTLEKRSGTNDSQDSRENKTNCFPRDYTLSALFPLNSHLAKINKQRRHNFFIHNRQSC